MESAYQMLAVRKEYFSQKPPRNVRATRRGSTVSPVQNGGRGPSRRRESYALGMRMHPTFRALLVLGSMLTMANCGSSTTTTSSATTVTTATADSSTTQGSVAAGSSTVATSDPADTTLASSNTAPRTTSPGLTATRGSAVVAPGRATPATEGARTAVSISIDTSLQATIDLAVADLAKELQVDASAITTVSAKSVEWPDKSDGCPQPGMSYSQVPVDGVQIVLSSNGTSYEYHSGGSRTPFLCKKG